MSDDFESAKEGWGRNPNMNKWHYFVEGADMTLCRQWFVFIVPFLEQGKDDHPDNCAKCKRKLEKKKG